MSHEFVIRTTTAMQTIHYEQAGLCWAIFKEFTSCFCLDLLSRTQSSNRGHWHCIYNLCVDCTHTHTQAFSMCVLQQQSHRLINKWRRGRLVVTHPASDICRGKGPGVWSPHRLTGWSCDDVFCLLMKTELSPGITHDHSRIDIRTYFSFIAMMILFIKKFYRFYGEEGPDTCSPVFQEIYQTFLYWNLYKSKCSPRIPNKDNKKETHLNTCSRKYTWSCLYRESATLNFRKYTRLFSYGTSNLVCTKMSGNLDKNGNNSTFISGNTHDHSHIETHMSSAVLQQWFGLYIQNKCTE